MVRDRLQEFQNRGMTDRFEDVELGTQIRTPSPDQVEAHISHIKSLLDDLQDEIFSLKKKQDRVLALAVTEPGDRDDLEQHISAVKRSVRQLQPLFQEVEDEYRQFERECGNKTSAELRIRKNQIERLRRKLNDVLRLFNDTQIDYKERVSKRVKRGLDVSGIDVSEPEVDRMINSHAAQVFYREINPLSIAGRIALEDAQQRHNEIMELENSLTLLQEMFTDMYTLVHAQGEMVDNIEKNTTTAVDHVQQASTHTKQAVEYKKSAMRKKICVIVTIIIIILLIILAIVLATTLTK